MQTLDWTHISVIGEILQRINSAFTEASKEVVMNGRFEYNGTPSYIISIDTFDKLANAIRNIKSAGG